jgi:hypothetical protein
MAREWLSRASKWSDKIMAKKTRPKPGKSDRVPYLTVDGKRVPSVTTVIPKSVDALIHWAWLQGMAGIDYQKTRDDAATVGSIVHKYAEFAADNPHFTLPHSRVICRDEKVSPDQAAQVRQAFTAWQQWAKENDFKVTQQEVRLVSEQHLFGGTFDLMSVRRKRCISDYKTSKSLYQSHLVQLAAYGLLWKEAHPCKECHNGECSIGWVYDPAYFKQQGHHRYPTCPKCKGTKTSKPIHLYQLIHLDKESGLPNVRQYNAEDIEPAEELFLVYRKAYGLQKLCGKRYKLR